MKRQEGQAHWHYLELQHLEWCSGTLHDRTVEVMLQGEAEVQRGKAGCSGVTQLSLGDKCSNRGILLPAYLSFRTGVPVGETVPSPSLSVPHHPQELMVKFPLKEIQSTRTQRPTTAGSSCPYVEVALKHVTAQHTVQLQLEQVGPQGAPVPTPTPKFCVLGSPQLGQVLGSVQSSAGDRAKPTLHRPVGLGVVLERYSRGMVDPRNEDPGCLQKNEVSPMGNWGGPKCP